MLDTATELIEWGRPVDGRPGLCLESATGEWSGTERVLLLARCRDISVGEKRDLDRAWLRKSNGQLLEEFAGPLLDGAVARAAWDAERQRQRGDPWDAMKRSYAWAKRRLEDMAQSGQLGSYGFFRAFGDTGK